MNMTPIKVDVCIVGAGFAGLAAAYKLKQASKSVAVLEARDRVGGKVFTKVLSDGTCINMGGTWLGEGHTRIHALAAEVGLETFRQYVAGDNVMIMNGKVGRYSGVVPKVNVLALVDVGVALKALNAMAGSVPPEAPWNAENAREWDATTVGAWIASRWHATTDTAQKLLRLVFAEQHMCDPNEVSLLHALHLIHSSRSIEWLSSTIGGAQQDHVAGGTHGIAERIAAKLGDVVHLGTPVRRVLQDSAGVEVTSDKTTVRAHRVIVTLPMTLAGRLEYEPELPVMRTALMDRSPQGHAFKWHAIYPEPFWRADGFSGFCLNVDGAPEGCVDCTPRDGKPGVLAALAFGPSARELATVSAEDRRRTCLDGLVKFFGLKAAEPIDFTEMDWAAEKYSRGDVLAHWAPGVLTSFGKALREPCGRIHWAGTETAPYWHGSIEGAVQSGERAADEVLAYK
jgi:monoamine oxidase